MADKKITELVELATPALEDLLAIIDDPSGSPVTKKTTLQSIKDLIAPNLAVGAKAGLSVAQENLVHNTWTVVELDNTDFNIGSHFNTTTHGFLVPVTGYYQVNINVAFQYLVIDKRYRSGIVWNLVAEGKNHPDTLIFDGHASTTEGGSHNVLGVGGGSLVYFEEDDFIQLMAQSNSGGNTVDIERGPQYTFMSIWLVSEA